MLTRVDYMREQRWFYLWLGVAAAAHVALLAALLFLQFLDLRQHPPLQVVQVSLISIPGSQGVESEPKARSTPASTAPEKKVTDLTPVALKKAVEPLALKQATSTPEAQTKKIQPATKTPVKLPEPTLKSDTALNERKNLQASLDNLRKKVADRTPEVISEPSNLGTTLANLQKKVASAVTGTAFSGNQPGIGGAKTFDPYKAEIAGIIQSNWAFSSWMIRNSFGMEVYVSIFVLSDGTVTQIRYERQSTSEYLNNSVRVALDKSVPFPPFPREYGSNGLWIHFIFTPEGIGH
ncbi:MAG: cell envelope integrity protein TolA [Chlorobiaceae bacterium]|nr:cell envelope integrity protein TolA [Chlorobiaceae bacterium]